jgi:hypothetical protein
LKLNRSIDNLAKRLNRLDPLLPTSHVPSGCVRVASPIAFDWCFVNYYFHKFLGWNPFGVSGIDLKSVWLGKTNCKWHTLAKEDIKTRLGLDHIVHTHNALEDAKEQSIIFRKMIEFTPVLEREYK